MVAGATEVVLSQDDSFLSPDWVPGAPGLRIESTPARTADGDVISRVTRGNVSEVLPLLVNAGDPYQTASLMQQIEGLILDAEQKLRTYQGDQLYLTFQPAGGIKHRTPIFTGSLALTSGALRAFGKGRLAQTLTLYRAPWWEAMAETELRISNRHGTNVTGGLRIDNHSDGSAADNFVDILGTEVLGNYAAPIRLSLANASSGPNVAYSWRNIFAGRLSRTGTGFTPSQFVHYIQGESATSGGATVATAATDSGSAIRRFTVPVSTVANPITKLGYWTLTTAQCNALAGGLVQVLVRFGTTNAPDITKVPRLQFWLESNTSSNVPLMRTPDVALSGKRLEAMGTLAIPPGLPDLANDTAIYLSLWGYAETAHDLDIDFIQLIPVESFRTYLQSVGDLNADGTLHDDGTRVYVASAAGVNFQRTVPTGTPIVLSPARNQRLYFLFDEVSDAMVIARRLNVRAFYRPRILSLGTA